MPSVMSIYQDFLYYKSGIYQRTSDVYAYWHIVEIIGYGKSEGIHYYICKNPMGSNWGESGYFRIKIGDCGVGQNVIIGNPEL
ncbi:MAG: hypothetical protein MJ252_05675 [archaeon]|nr:hypothetical protein [archaeon]